jgi:hypothetical protein
MLQNLAFKALTFKLLFDGCPGQHAAAKNRKKDKDKGVDGQRLGLKSRTFDNFRLRPLFVFASLHSPKQPSVQEKPVFGIPKKLQNLASKALTLKLLFDCCPVQHIAAKKHKIHKDKEVDWQRHL